MSLQLSPWVHLWIEGGSVRGVRFALVIRRRNSTLRYVVLGSCFVRECLQLRQKLKHPLPHRGRRMRSVVGTAVVVK